jgi:two-component system response regulator GlrR
MARILIVDDDPVLLRMIAKRLTYEGHTPSMAGSGPMALSKLDFEEPDILITEMRMPGMDGFELFDAVHRRFPLIPVIMLTANGTIPDACNAMQRGMFGYIPKPFETEELMREVNRALEVSSAFGADMPGEDPGDTRREAIVTRSARMRKTLTEARLVAKTDASVLISGSSGTGKELLARALHAASARAGEEFVAVNCGAIPENLVESELFGHVKGSFTGAMRDSVGMFTTAHRGTIFLDEIADLPLAMQTKLLRVLQEREVRPVGALSPHKVDVRVIAASNRKLEAEVAAGRFREDLFYRLNVVPLEIPQLTERREDIELLAEHFMRAFVKRYAKPITGFAPGALELFTVASWPGNVRQLRNVVEKCVVLCAGSTIPVSLIQGALTNQGDELLPYDEARKKFERSYIETLLKFTNGSVTTAAKVAQRNRTDFYTLLARHQLAPASFKA